ncbi:hypothetical protein LVD15_17300 [Fulvivirga maritima]|uniref:hypothetical protein n=1 Tax=Fulvivirga maritima TaxID=2904247 RepID=UPI001F1BC3D7|nr:hypothetical protein [Fulvivirga maritima]UII25057.1 hypothetical protein LVD15_17300 [Fulvivirga maritima]
MSEDNSYDSEVFASTLEKCRLFKLKYPKGGQYNDGFELNGTLHRNSAHELLGLLDDLGVDYMLHDTEPELEKDQYGFAINWCRPIVVDNKKKWLELNNRSECFGFKTYLQVNPDQYTITFNFNSTSWYDVVLEDVERALSFENELDRRGLV